MISRLDVKRPTLILDEDRGRRNIGRMKEKADAARVKLRPHFKTHQSAEVGRWFAEAGIEAITVSSVSMAEYFAGAGWSDILIAFPVNPRELDAIGALAAHTRLALLIDAPDVLPDLSRALHNPVSVWVKVDCGYGRVGIPWDDSDRIASLASQIRGFDHLSFAGILTHSGHTYHARTADAIRAIASEVSARIQEVRSRVEAAGLRPCAVSIGDTPSCSLQEEFPGVDDIRPGNFVFYDAMQHQLGVCRDEDIAVAVAAPVVSVYPRRGEIAVYAGAVHLSKESIPGDGGLPVYGYLFDGAGDRLGRLIRDAPVVRLSQEHGIVHIPSTRGQDPRIGDLVLIAPVHACLTANLYSRYRTLDGRMLSRRREEG